MTEPNKKLTPIPSAKPYFSLTRREKIKNDIDRILSSGQVIMGTFALDLEAAFAYSTGARYAVSVNSCTTALQICLRYFDVKGHDVLVPSGSFVSDISAIEWEGGRPILVDMNPDTLSFDLQDMQRKLTPKTKGMIWVHLTGVISHEYTEIVRFAKRHGLFLIEDCAHAHGATIDGRQCGTIGDAGCYSFFATKLMTSGSGGMITTADLALDQFAREVRMFGRSVKTGEPIRIGNDWFLDEVRACIAYHQLAELDEFLRRRREIAARYFHALQNQPGLSLLNVPEGSDPAFYQYPVFLDSVTDNSALCKTLKETYGIAAKRIYTPTHREPFYRHYDDGTLQKTETTLNRSICLPMFYELTNEQADYIASALITELRRVR
ncbi:MAG: DegT/DnrJ/EryC1/StrS family aminotransferase [Alphaproteobacteria bacterium]